MARQKIIAYVQEDLLRSVRVLAASRGDEMDDVLEDALRRYLASGSVPERVESREVFLQERISTRATRRMPGTPRIRAAALETGNTLSEAVLAETESRDY